MRSAVVLVLAVAGAGAGLAQQAPTPVPQTVVVPSLPDQKNKEGTVSPGGAMKSDAGGWVDTSMGQIDPNAPKPAGAASTSGTSAPAAGPGIAGVAPPPPPEPGPRGKTVVEAAYLTVKGVVKSFEKGSITVTEASGKDRTVPLADKAAVYEGLAVGDKVAVRIPLKKPADGKSADRVEKQKPPKTVPKSKFASAQTPG